jgi:endonuclease III-like uncharacterized protein
MFPVYSEKYLSRKAVQTWVEKISHGRSNVKDDTRQGAEVAERTVKNFHAAAETHSKYFYAAGLDALVMQWGKCVNIGEGYVQI